MAARRDYGQKRSGKGATRSTARKPAGTKKPAASQQRFPWIKLVVAISLIGGMGYSLYHLSQTMQQTSPPATQPPALKPAYKPQPKPADKPASRSSTKEQPPQEVRVVEEPRFEFYQMLVGSEVSTDSVDAYKSTPKGAKTEYKYLLQAGSFRSAKDAEKMRARLILMGLPNAKTSKTTGQNGTWYRVRVGPFDNRSLLNRAHDKLVKISVQPMEIKIK